MGALAASMAGTVRERSTSPRPAPTTTMVATSPPTSTMKRRRGQDTGSSRRGRPLARVYASGVQLVDPFLSYRRWHLLRCHLSGG